MANRLAARLKVLVNKIFLREEIKRSSTCVLEKEATGILLLVVNHGLSGLEVEGLSLHSKTLCSSYGHWTRQRLIKKNSFRYN